jgi:hypothetical protein
MNTDDFDSFADQPQRVDPYRRARDQQMTEHPQVLLPEMGFPAPPSPGPLSERKDAARGRRT